MKAQTALGIFIVFAATFLVLGFYGHAIGDCDPPCASDEVCRQGSCEPRGGGAASITATVSKDPILLTDTNQYIEALATDTREVMKTIKIFADNSLKKSCDVPLNGLTCRFDFNGTDFSVTTHTYYAEAFDVAGASLRRDPSTGTKSFTIANTSGQLVDTRIKSGTTTVSYPARGGSFNVESYILSVATIPNRAKYWTLSIDGTEIKRCTDSFAPRVCTSDAIQSATYDDGQTHTYESKILAADETTVSSSPARTFVVGGTSSCGAGKTLCSGTCSDNCASSLCDNNPCDGCTQQTCGGITLCTALSPLPAFRPGFAPSSTSTNPADFTTDDARAMRIAACLDATKNNVPELKAKYDTVFGTNLKLFSPTSDKIRFPTIGWKDVLLSSSQWHLETPGDACNDNSDCKSGSQCTGLSSGGAVYYCSCTSTSNCNPGLTCVSGKCMESGGPGACEQGQYVNRLSGWESAKLNDCNHVTTKYVAGRVFSNYDPAGGVTDALMTALKIKLTATKVSNKVIDFGTDGKVDVISNCCSASSMWQWVVTGPGGGIPVITSVNPLFVKKGDMITITGTNLMDPNGKGVVQFIDSRGDPAGRESVFGTVNAAGTVITINVPTGVLTGSVRVRVYNAADKISNEKIITVKGDTPPVTRITAPAASSVQTGNFSLSVTDTDDTGLDKCYYTTGNSAPTALPRGNIALSNPYQVWRPLDVAYSTKSDVSLAIWSTAHEGKVIGQFINGDGTLRGGNAVVGSHNDFVGAIKITYDEDDDLFLVAWGSAVGNNMGPTYGSLVKPDGTFVKQNFVIVDNCDLGIHASSSGNIAYSKDAKKFYVACTRGIITRGIIIGNSVTPDGTVGNEVAVTGGDMFGSSVAAGGSTVLVTWFDSNGVAYGRLYDPNGAALTSPIRVSTGVLGGYVVLVAFYDSTRNEYTAFYWGSVDKKLYKRVIGPTGTLGTESTVFTNNNVGVSDIAYNSLTGSYFIADQHSADYGNGYIEISSSGSVSASVRVSEDVTLPHYTPAIIATKNNVPLTIMNQAGDAYAQFGGTGGAITGGKLRTCNSQTTISVGSGGDCSHQGTCTISAFARDVDGNVGASDSRSFIIRLISTNITSPAAESNQTGNFSVEVQDRDFTSAVQGLTCTYDVYSIGSASTKTVDNAGRRCNSNFTVTVGPDGNCTSIGQGSCKVVAKVSKTVNSANIEATSERFYNIDWVTPYSEIVSAPSNWVNSDFSIAVKDDAQGIPSRISKCQYKVVSNGTQSLPWTDRVCGIDSLVSIPITVGPGKNCRHEGGDACTIFVRPIDRSGNPGIEDSVSVPVMFNVTVDGFSSTITTQTEKGLSFSGTTRQELRASTFYVCNKNSNVDRCITAYNSNNRGANKPNFCGSLLGSCEVRCSDQAVSYYFAARGSPVGQSTTVTVVSSIMNAACPTFNIDQINQWYQIFTLLETQIGTEIGIVDTCINQNGMSLICNNETLVILREALLITKDHLRNMTLEMRDLTVTKARELIQRSIDAHKDISDLLYKIRAPTLVTLTVNMPDVVRFNRSTLLTTIIDKDGPTDAYGTVYCAITKPGNVVQQNNSGCLVLGGSGQHSSAYSIPFMPDRFGTWTYSCKLGRSVRPDCSFEVNQTPVSGTFAVLPVQNTFITSVSTPSTALKGSLVNANIGVRNPDDMDKFVNVTCNFKYISGTLITRRNSSDCTSLPATADTSVPVKMYASTLGEWNVSGCSVYSSLSSNCASQALDNTSLDTASYMVILPDMVFIESVGLPQAPVLNNSLLSIPAVVNNPTNDVAYTNLSCLIERQTGSMMVTDRKGVDNGRTSTFSLNFTPDYVGAWFVDVCNLFVSPNPDFSDSTLVYTLDNVGTFNVIARNNLTITSVDTPNAVQNNTPVVVSVSITNPSNSRYGRAFCTVTDPVNKAHTNSSACSLVTKDVPITFPVDFFANRTGEWHISQCSVYGSANADCSSSSLHDRQTFVDKSFSSTTSCTRVSGNATNPSTGECREFFNECLPSGWTTTGACPIVPNTIRITAVLVPTSAINNSNVNIDTTVLNSINDDRFAQVSCSVRNPLGSSQLLTSSCDGIPTGTSHTYRTILPVNTVGLWNVTTCSVNAGISCNVASLQHSVNASKTFNVIRGINLSFVSFTLPTDTQVNNTATATINVRNPSDVARYAKVSCSFRNPKNQLASNSTSCVQVAGTSVSPFDMNIYANVVGTWSVETCALRGSLDSSCSTVYDSKSNIGTFNITGFNVGPGCTRVSGNATNPSTGECREFFNECLPSGWTTTGACPIVPNTIRITAVLVPTSAINNSNVNIDTTVLNSINDDRFAQVNCAVKDPNGATYIRSSSCEGIAAGASHTYRTTLAVSTVGLWNVTTCSVSAGLDCSSATLQHSLNAGKTFNVIRGINLSFVSFILPPDTLVNNTVALTAVIRNPSDAARYARLFCSFRNQQNQQTSNSTPCLQVAGTSTPSFAVNIFADAAGTWRAESCTLRGSLDSSCSALHDSASNIGTFNITTTTPPPSIALSQLFISNISANPTAINSSQINVFVYGRNNNPANSSYALVGCDFLNSFGSSTRQTSSCLQITANSTVRFSVSQLMNAVGTWTVRNCFINASSMNNCAPSILHNVSTETRPIAVSLPPNLYITSVSAPGADVVNNTNVNIDVFVNNPLNDDKYGFVSCIMEDPNGDSQTRTTTCSSVPRQTSNKKYNVSVFANVVGSWNVKNCSVSSSTSSSCAGSTLTGELINGDTFNVVRGYNLTLSSLSVPQSVYVNRPLSVAYTLRNPSTSDRLARVTCTITKGGQSIVNTSSCMTIGPESFIDNNALFAPASTGTWSVTCVAERSFDASCTSLEVHDRDSENFNVTYPPDLFIQSIDVPSLALKDSVVSTTLRIRNTAFTSLYGFAECTFKNRLNETTYNASECLNMTSDTTIINLGVTPALRGNWTVYNCYVNATPLSNCSSSRVHNISTTEKSFNVYAPVLSFDGNISLASSNLMVGDVADIIVNVKNTGERPYLTFVNCTLVNPLRVSYMLTTPPQTLQIGETRDFHPQREVDVSGTWKVGTCSIYSISSPPKLEASKIVNQIFDVLYVASTDECSNNVPCQTGFTCQSGTCVANPVPQCSASNCPGTKDGCYCSNDRCVSCGQGYTCSQARCVPETPIINTCRASNDCTTGNVCVNGVCQQKPVECYSDGDCGVNYACRSGNCVVSVQKPLLDEKIIYFLIILLAVIMVPIILFIYIKRSI
ncbi:MAG: dickkopf-related protein [Candidatus Aenigmatarchaeota archaeon]